MRRAILGGLLVLLTVGSAQAGPFGLFGHRRARWSNECVTVGWQQQAEPEQPYPWSYQAAPCNCGQPAAVAPLQQGPVNAANPANAVQPMPANPPRLLGTAPGT